MNSNLQIANIVEGEASESDDDYEVTSSGGDLTGITPRQPDNDSSFRNVDRQNENSCTHRPPVASTIQPSARLIERGQSKGSVLFGEAAESKDESQADSLHLRTPLKVEGQPESAKSSPLMRSLSTNPSVTMVPYDDLLHRKLKETNDRLLGHIETFKAKRIENATKDLRNIYVQLCRSHATIKDVSANLRVVSNDLLHLEDKLDIVASCKLIPYINISPTHQNARTMLQQSSVASSVNALPS